MENLGFSSKNRWIFEKKNNFFKIATGSKLRPECEWISKISQNFQNLAVVWKKNRWVFPNDSWFFFKIAKRSNFAVKCDWKSKTSQNVQNLFLLNEIYGFLEKKLWFL